MILNFYLELAAFVIGIILWCASFGQYRITDLKGKVYAHMIRMTTIMTGCNICAYIIIRNNISILMSIAEIIICLSFLMMVWFWMYLNLYLIEVIRTKNSFSYKVYIGTGLPLFVELIVILMNWGTHSLFDVSILNDSVQVVFNTWYKVPYILTGISLLIYLYYLVKYRKSLIDKRQNILFLVPVILLGIYYLQYRFKSVAILGFGYVVVLLLMYIYSYNRTIKIDSLTRLPDGSVFKQMLDYRIGQKQSMTVAMITLDDFKHVNREYGYHNGNRFLKLIAKYVKTQAPKQCMARYSGDKFAVVFDEHTYQDVQEWCNEILERFERTWELGKLHHKLSVCISLVEYPAMAETSEQILDLLEHMNTYGKKNKRNQCIICNDEFKEQMQRRLKIASILNEVVQERTMYVEYQPILEVEANAFTRAEALFRLKDEKLGDVPSTEFIPIAEENGYIIDIGYIMLEQVCQYIKMLEENSSNVPIISINFSRQQIMDEAVDMKVKAILEKYNVMPEYIAFELPESVFAVQYNAVKGQILRLHQLGCRFYLDGFGNAFLDLPRLMELPFEVIKINETMIKEAEENDSIYLLVSAMTAVFEENGKLILGDGIESEHLKEMADFLFMDFLQGHFLCAPLTAEFAQQEFERTDVIEPIPDMETLLKEIAEGEALTTMEDGVMVEE